VIAHGNSSATAIANAIRLAGPRRRPRRRRPPRSPPPAQRAQIV
jgi:hypothetical protein